MANGASNDVVGDAQMDIPDKRFYRPDEVATALEVSLRSVYRWVAKGYIQHIHCGSKIRVHREEMDRILRVGIRPHSVAPNMLQTCTCSRCGSTDFRGTTLPQT